MKESWAYVVLPLAVVIGGYYAFIKLLTGGSAGDNWFTRFFNEQLGETNAKAPTDPVSGGTDALLPPYETPMTYPEGTMWVIAPGIGSPAPMLPGTEWWWDLNYPGWQKVGVYGL